MKRKLLTKKLERIMKVIESGETPRPVKKLWVFGSYARGALECGDLDLAIEIDRPDHSWYEENGIMVIYPECYHKFWQLMRDSLKKRGERIEILTGNPAKDEEEGWHKDAILIWDEDSPNRWRSAITSIKPDPNAGRFTRDVNLKRTGTSLIVWENFQELVSKQYLTMTVVDMKSLQPHMTPEQEDSYETCVRLKIGAEKILELVPYAFDWLNRENIFSDLGDWDKRTIVFSRSGAHFVHMGKIDFGYASGWLLKNTEAKKLCLIPHLYKRSKNEMYIIEKGSSCKD